MDNRFNGQRLNWIKGNRSLRASSPQGEENGQKNCVSCISYIEGVCPNVPITHQACGAHNKKEFYELCVLIKISQEGID